MSAKQKRPDTEVADHDDGAAKTPPGSGELPPVEGVEGLAGGEDATQVEEQGEEDSTTSDEKPGSDIDSDGDNLRGQQDESQRDDVDAAAIAAPPAPVPAADATAAGEGQADDPPETFTLRGIDIGSAETINMIGHLTLRIAKYCDQKGLYPTGRIEDFLLNWADRGVVGLVAENRSIVYLGLAAVREELCAFLNGPGSKNKVRQITVRKFQAIISDATRSMNRNATPARPTTRGQRGQVEAAVAGTRLLRQVDDEGRDGLEFMDRRGVVHGCCVLRADKSRPGVFEQEARDVTESEKKPWGRDGSTAVVRPTQRTRNPAGPVDLTGAEKVRAATATEMSDDEPEDMCQGYAERCAFGLLREELVRAVVQHRQDEMEATMDDGDLQADLPTLVAPAIIPTSPQGSPRARSETEIYTIPAGIPDQPTGMGEGDRTGGGGQADAPGRIPPPVPNEDTIRAIGSPSAGAIPKTRADRAGAASLQLPPAITRQEEGQRNQAPLPPPGRVEGERRRPEAREGGRLPYRGQQGRPNHRRVTDLRQTRGAASDERHGDRAGGSS